MSERERHELYLFIEDLFGRHTEAFLNALAPDLPDRLERVAAELRGDMAALRVELRGEMAELRGELRGEMAELRGEMAELRGEMAELRAEVRTEVRGILPKLIWANLASTFAVGGLVLAAVSIA